MKYFFKLYQLLWGMAPILRCFKRLRQGFAERLVPDNWLAVPVDLWLQSASGGEAYLVAELLKVWPQQTFRILLTTWTNQGLTVLQQTKLNLAASHPNLQVEICYFPLDSPKLMAKALGMAKPKLVAVLETELWPGLFWSCAQAKIPVVVLNGRLTAKSMQHYGYLAKLGLDWSKLAPIKITATSKLEAQRFQDLFKTQQVQVVANIKFDREPALPTQKLQLPPTILLASTRKQEEDLLLPVVQELSLAAPTAWIIIAPRHMHRVKNWVQKLGKLGLKPQLISDIRGELGVELRGGLNSGGGNEGGELGGAQLQNPTAKLIIWDSFGELGQLYAASQAIFVGGSLYPLGGQNFLEPLSLGKIPCTGPYLSNFNFALESLGTSSLVDLGLLKICQPSNLGAALLEQWNSKTPTPCSQTPEMIQVKYAAWVMARQGGSKQNVDLLLQVLAKGALPNKLYLVPASL